MNNKIKWTKELCHIEALKYQTRSEFEKGSYLAYSASIRNKWHTEICSHMIYILKPSGYWTIEKIRDEALKYENRFEFQKKGRGAYFVAIENKWLDDVCSHMKPLGNYRKRLIYSYEFSDNFVYVGLTFNIKKRNIQHKFRGPVYQHSINTNINPTLHLISDGYIEIDKAVSMEIEIIEKYKKDGWKLLNSAKGGGIGSTMKYYTKESIQIEALKYKYRSEFYYNSPNYYQAACRYGWLNDVCSHMKNKYVKWTIEMIKEIALKYTIRNEFHKNEKYLYLVSLKRGWLDEVCSHMSYIVNLFWTKDTIHEEALKYNTRYKFMKNSCGAYKKAYKNKWLDEVCSHMKNKKTNISILQKPN